MNERQAQSLDIPLPPAPLSTVEIYVGVGRGFYQSGRHSCASTRRPGVGIAEQVLIRATLTRSLRIFPSCPRRPGFYPAKMCGVDSFHETPRSRNFASIFDLNFSTLVNSSGFR